MKRVCAVVLLSFGLAASAAAQRTTGEIIGKVVDESGSVLPGVTVTLRGAGVAGAPTVVTSETGTYRFPVLPPGTYRSNTRSPASDAQTRGHSSRRRPTVELEVSMKVGALEESITVSGESPVVNVVSSEVSTTYNRQWVENAPVERFSYFDLVNSAPGVSATSNVGQATAAQSLGTAPTRTVPNRRHRHQLDAVAVHRRGGGSRSAPARGVGGVRQRPGRGLQHRHADGRQPVPRRWRLLPADRRDDRAQHDRCGRRRAALPSRQHWDASIQATGPFMRDKFWFFGSLQYQTGLGLSTRHRSEDSGVERLAARVLEVQLQDHPEPPVDARVSQRLLLHPDSRVELHGAELDRPQPRRQSDAEPRVHRRVVGQDLIEARYRVLAAQLDRSERDRAEPCAGRDSRTRIPVTSPATSRLGSRTEAGATATRRSCRT